MKAIKKVNVKTTKTKTKTTATKKARLSLASSGAKAVIGCPELHYRK